MTSRPHTPPTGTLDERLSALSPAKRAFVEAALRARDGARAESGIPRRAGNAAPVSFAQELLWRFEQSLPGTSTYNVPRAFRVRGRVDAERLSVALDALVERHEILRTVFQPHGDDVPRQVVRPPQHVPLQVVELPALNGEVDADTEARAQALLRDAAMRPFDLASDVLLRATLVQLAPDEHLLLLLSHHIASDGASGDVLMRDLCALYSGTDLPPLAVQYGDFAEWQRRELTPARIDALVAHWRERLAGAPAMVELPTNRARPVAPTFRGARCTLMLPPTVADAVTRVCSARGTTPFMFFLACTHALLARYTGQDDITVGTVLTRRGRPELESLVGYFSNVLPVRVTFDESVAFGDLLAHVRAESLDLDDHAGLPFETLALALRDGPSVAGVPMVQVMFSMLPGDAAAPALGSARLTPMQLDRGIAKFDLTFAAGTGADGLRLMIEYATDLFDGESAERMLGHYATIIGGAAAHPDTPVAELPLLSQAERDLVTSAWNDTAAEWPTGETLASLLAAQAERTPHARAVVCGRDMLTYRELHERATTLARYLRSRGVFTGDLVGVCMERSLDMVVALCGVILAGAAYVPLDPELPVERLAFMISDANVPLLLTQHHLRGVAGESKGVVVVLDTEWDLIATAAAAAPVPDAPEPGDLAYMIYTSGSTGRPKGALNTHAGIVNRLLWMQREYALTARDVVLQKTPFSFDVSVWEFFWPLITGARLVMATPGGHRDPAYLVGAVVEHGVTVMHFVPSMLRAFLDADGVEQCISLRDVMCSGEALPYELQQRFFERLGAGLHNLYGPTEAAVDVTYWRCDPTDARHVVPIGRPVANTQMYVLDRRMQPVPVGIAGELYIGGMQVGKGYHNRPDLTAERFIPDPFARRRDARLYRTGDLARWLSDGTLEYLGRLDHQVKLRGFRIELGEIEMVLARHGSVADAVVTAPRTRDGEPMLVAYYVARAGSDPLVPELRAHLRRELPEYMVPSAFVRMDALPLTPSGKLDRKALPEPRVARDAMVAYVAPRSETERVIASIWHDVLHRDAIGVHDHFFSVGGHSLLAMRVVGHIRARLGVSVPFTRVFESPTIATLAQIVDEMRVHPAGATAVADTRGAPARQAPLTPVQRMFWTQEQMTPERGMYHIRLAFTASGPLDVDALQRAVDTIVARHGVFRTTFRETDDGPVQVVARSARVEVALYDIPRLAPEAQDAAAMAQLGHDAVAPFDLAREPLLRVTVVRLAPDRAMLQVVVHHLVFDGWSVSVFLRELSALYSAERAGRTADLAALPTQFSDWATQLHDGNVADGDASLTYWTGKLAGMSRVLPLPRVAHARSGDELVAERAVLVVPEPVLEEFLTACRASDASLFMGLVAALHVVLAAESGSPDVTIAAPIAARSSVEVAGLIGCFANTVALRSELAGGPTCREALERTRMLCLDAYPRATVPLDEVMLHLGSAQETRTAGPIPVMLVLQDDARATYRLDDVALVPMEIAPGRAACDLKISVTRVDSGLRLAAEYRVSALAPDTVHRVLDEMASVMRAMVATPDARIDTILAPAQALPRSSSAAQLPAEHAAASNASLMSPLEQVIAGVWREVLGRSTIAVDSDFLDVGGHSLLAIKVVARLSRLFRTRLPVRMFFEHPTIHAFAVALAASDDGAQAASVAQALVTIQAMSPAEREARRNARVDHRTDAPDGMPS